MSALGLLRPGQSGPHRHPVPLRPRRDTSGISRAAGTCPSASAAKANPPPLSAPASTNTWIEKVHLAPRRVPFYSHLLPFVSIPPPGNSNRVAGDGWLAVGDAAGLSRPHHRRRPLLCHALRRSRRPDPSSLDTPKLLTAARSVTISPRDLEFGSRLARRIFQGTFHPRLPYPAAWSSSPAAARKFKSVIQDLFAGTQNYHGTETQIDEKPQRKSLPDRDEFRFQQDFPMNHSVSEALFARAKLKSRPAASTLRFAPSAASEAHPAFMVRGQGSLHL